MPKFKESISYYTCEFKCGTGKMRLTNMQRHEKKCYCNPVNKACRICANCSFSQDALICKAKKLLYFTRQNEDQEVLNLDDESRVWIRKDIPNDPYFGLDKEIEAMEHNKTRPFPTVNCDLFVLGKKVY